MSRTTGADIIARALAAAGASRAFGIPGGEVLALMQALDRAGIGFTLTRHENAAGFIAEGHWHATGALPVLLATLGPGVANAVNVVANAHQDRVPLIFLTGCVEADVAETYTHQVFDHRALLAPVTKASFRATPGALGPMMAKAIGIATACQPGPVHIDVPIAVAEGAADEPGAAAQPRTAAAAPTGDTLHAARAALAAAKRPIAIAGLDAVNEGAGAAVASFCRTRAVPLITSYKGKGLLDEGDPLSLGGAGLSPKADAILLPLLQQSDCILLLGYDPIEMRANWRNPWPADATVIEIASAPRSHGMHTVSHLLTGTLAGTLPLLAPALTNAPNWAAEARRALAEAFAPGDWGPAAVFDTLRDIVPADTVITADSGAHRILLSQIWRCAGPRTMLQSTALCTMACAVPLAAGYALGAPGRPVIAFVGDAGLEMGLGELATLRDLRLPVVIVVLVDESLALIELKQRGAQRPNLGVDFGGTDFPAVAAALGGHGVWVDDADTLRTEAGAALAREGFTILACRIGRRAYDGAF
ncbi:thiamine pyrophosphate-binding protein [Rhodobacteraceae bacterium 2CG4]|uniref:Thiamine pyrophosphate-binding protein n=1 Tax=Halovulum marinum TaxID=2662447 RepID=A0A6L5YZL1_9RHOB|nr:thiamine pyrophosphate-binding protein [Halovulum marinum]MSU89449.1 thiamine pyrophosphate-binding protein [Halovulum marinum]